MLLIKLSPVPNLNISKSESSPKSNFWSSAINKSFDPDVLPAAKTALNAGVVIVGILSSTYFFVAKFKSDVGAIPVTEP